MQFGARNLIKCIFCHLSHVQKGPASWSRSSGGNMTSFGFNQQAFLHSMKVQHTVQIRPICNEELVFALDATD